MKWLIQWAVTSSVLILIVLAVRFLFREKLSARLRYALWGVVLLRLLFPFQLEGLPAQVYDALPVVASNLAVPLEARLDQENQRLSVDYVAMVPSELVTWEDIQKGEDVYLSIPLPYDHAPLPDGLPVSEEDVIYRTIGVGGFNMDRRLLTLWRTGAAVTGGAILLSNLLFFHKLRKRRRPLEGADASLPVYTAEGLSSPCLFGVFSPAVYVPPQAAERPDSLRHVLAHELTHYAHRDHIWSLLRILALALHWYNPLVWLSVVLSKGDGELACDEGAVARLGESERIPYGRTLVDMVAARSLRPGDLLSCSTAMTGGKKSIQRRVAQLVKKPETVKTALFALVAVAALATVFVFAGRGEAATELDTFLARLEGAQSIFVGNPAISSALPPGPISDPKALAQAKSLLEKVQPVARLEDDSWSEITLDSNHPPEPIGQEELEHQFFMEGRPLNLCPTPDGDLETAHRCWLVPWGAPERYLLVLWDAEREEDAFTILGLYPAGTLERLREIARQNRAIDRFPALDSFQHDVADAQAIRLQFNANENFPYPDITDEDLLEQARDRLSLLEPPADDPPAPDLDALAESWQLTLISGGQERTYTLLAWNDYTYLVRGDAPEEYQGLAEGQTMELGPFWRTRTKTNILGSLGGLAGQQFSRMDGDRAASVFGGSSYHNRLSNTSGIYRFDRGASGERAITDLNLLLHARELLALEPIPQDEEVAWDGEGWTSTLTFSVRGPTQERSETSEWKYYIVPKDEESSYLCTLTTQGGFYLGTLSKEKQEELERLFQDQEELDGILLGALEDCDTIRFEDSADPDITSSAALERAKTILTSGLLIDDLNHAGETGDNERITIRGAGGRRESTFLVTNRSIREALHALARNPNSPYLTEGELAWVNEAFASDMKLPDGSYGPSAISCFFTSSYDDPTKIDLEEFLRYCPLSELVDETAEREEYRKVLEASWWLGSVPDLDNFLLPTPMHRYPRERVSALLKQYTGVTVEELDWGDMLYLEEYDSFYNFTSDFGPGFFPCTGGRIDGDTVLLWSDPDESGDRCELTLQKSGGRWLIRSHHTIYER